MTKVKKNPLAVEKLESQVRYKNVIVLPINHEKYTSLVKIEKAPAKIKGIIGKQYITPQKAQTAIETALAEILIKKSEKSVKSELSSIGIISEVDKAW